MISFHFSREHVITLAHIPIVYAAGMAIAAIEASALILFVATMRTPRREAELCRALTQPRAAPVDAS